VRVCVPLLSIEYGNNNNRTLFLSRAESVPFGKSPTQVSLWRRRVRGISTDVLLSGTKLVLRLTNAEPDGREHCLGPSDKIYVRD
jgi:hypothetical protein